MNEEPLSVSETSRIFLDSLVKWPETKLEKASKYINKNSESQIKRLESYGLIAKIKYDKFYTGLLDDDETNSALGIITNLNSSNSTFNNKVFATRNDRTRMYYKNNKLLKQFKECNDLYITITSVNNYEKILAHDIVCPNCGNIVSIDELVNGTDGCSYCKTAFRVSDLYPVATSYYHYSQKNKKALYWSLYAILSILLFPFFILFFLPFFIFVPIITILIAGIIVCSLIFIDLYIQKNKKITRYNKLQTFMKQYDPNFTAYMFEGKIIAMIKDIIYSDNPNNLVIYDCAKKVDFSHIIDTTFSDMSFNKMYEKDNKIYIDVTMKMKNIIYKNNRVKSKKQYFNVTVSRNINVYTTSNFRIDIINCKNCGASLNVEQDKNCKYCHTNYDYRDYDFVVENISIK